MQHESRAGNGRVDAVVFDLDGTLIDTMHAFADLAGVLIARNYGWDRIYAREQYLRTSGVPFFQQLETLFPGDRRNRLVQEEFEREKQAAFFAAEPPQDTLATLSGLRGNGVKVVVSSNNYERFVREYFQKRPHIPADLVL